MNLKRGFKKAKRRVWKGRVTVHRRVLDLNRRPRLWYNFIAIGKLLIATEFYSAAEQGREVLSGDLLKRLLLSILYPANQLALVSGVTLSHADDSPIGVKWFTEFRNFSEFDGFEAKSARFSNCPTSEVSSAARTSQSGRLS